jgi:CheY-like chemotaxis protein
MQHPSHFVVVVDDERDLLDMICSLFEDEGHRVLCLNHPVDTANLSSHPQPDLFLLDIMLPQMSGIELAKQLRQGDYSETPMVAMSASPVMLHMAQSSGLFQNTIPKPFDLDALLHMVETLPAPG